MFWLICHDRRLQIWTVVEISRLPDAAHRNKRKWINFVLAVPLFGVIAYYVFRKKEVTDPDDGDL